MGRVWALLWLGEALLRGFKCLVSTQQVPHATLAWHWVRSSQSKKGTWSTRDIADSALLMHSFCNCTVLQWLQSSLRRACTDKQSLCPKQFKFSLYNSTPTSSHCYGWCYRLANRQTDGLSFLHPLLQSFLPLKNNWSSFEVVLSF